MALLQIPVAGFGALGEINWKGRMERDKDGKGMEKERYEREGKGEDRGWKWNLGGFCVIGFRGDRRPCLS